MQCSHKKEIFSQNCNRKYCLIINEIDLKVALQQGLIAGAALDVYNEEPPIDLDLLKQNNFICTPHIGGNSYEAIVAMGMSALDHLLNFKKQTTK